MSPRTMVPALFLIASSQLFGSVIRYQDEATFAAAATISTVQDFDLFNPDSRFTTARIVTDGIALTTDLCPPSYCWTFIGSPDVDVATPPNALAANLAGNSRLIDFGSGRYVMSLGFWLTNASSAAGSIWDVVVTETDNTDTTFAHQAGGRELFGFVSDVGIAKVTLLRTASSNVFLDSLSRSEILGGAALPDEYTVTLPPAPTAPVPEPSTLLLSLPIIMLAACRFRRNCGYQVRGECTNSEQSQRRTKTR